MKHIFILSYFIHLTSFAWAQDSTEPCTQWASFMEMTNDIEVILQRSKEILPVVTNRCKAEIYYSLVHEFTQVSNTDSAQFYLNKALELSDKIDSDPLTSKGLNTSDNTVVVTELLDVDGNVKADGFIGRGKTATDIPNGVGGWINVTDMTTENTARYKTLKELGAVPNDPSFDSSPLLKNALEMYGGVIIDDTYYLNSNLRVSENRNIDIIGIKEATLLNKH